MIRGPEKALVVGLGRAAGGALLFSVPILMTNEMWSLGSSIAPLRLALLLILTPLLLFGLAHYIGFRQSRRPLDHVADAMVAIAVSAVGAAAILAVFGLLGPGMSLREVVGKIGVQITPASIGAMLARSQFGQQSDREKSRRLSDPHYLGELFIMGIGALFLSLSIAPTQEVLDISHAMTVWHQLALLIATVTVMHAFVYFVAFPGRVPISPAARPLGLFARFTMAGYAVVLLVSLFLLWIFGRVDGASTGETVSVAIILSFPGAIGAAAARLVL